MASDKKKFRIRASVNAELRLPQEAILKARQIGSRPGASSKARRRLPWEASSIGRQSRPKSRAARAALTPNGFYKNRSGFTLLELIIVLFLSLLILGLVTVYFAGLLSSTKLQATAREFSTSLRQARNLAKIHGEQQGWSVDLDSKEYGIEGRQVKKIPSHLELKIVDSTGEEVRSGQYRLVFDTNWSMDSAQFRLSDKKKAIGIELDPLLGAVITR